jgi:hypothetical protein
MLTVITGGSMQLPEIALLAGSCIMPHHALPVKNLPVTAAGKIGLPGRAPVINTAVAAYFRL